MLPGGWDLAHAIRLGIKPFAELGANSGAGERQEILRLMSGREISMLCGARILGFNGHGMRPRRGIRANGIAPSHSHLRLLAWAELPVPGRLRTFRT
jgi:hypothetical protein